jgi:hypothetical protein
MQTAVFPADTVKEQYASVATDFQTAAPPVTHYTLLPSGNGWQQALALPTVKLRVDGICFDTRVSGRMLWLELESGAVWGIFFRSNGAFISYRDLQRICLRLDEARFELTGRVLSHLAIMFGWSSAGDAGSFEQISSEIAENIVKEAIHTDKGWNHQYLLTDESVRRLSQPYTRQFQQGLASFAESLDQELLQLVQIDPVNGRFPFQYYNYLKHPLEKVCRNRRQALQAYPLLINNFCSEEPDHTARRLQHGIDLGNPLPTAVADYFRCSKTVARFLAEKELSLIGEQWSWQLVKLPKILELIRPDFWPRTADDWGLFNEWLLPIYDALDEKRNRSRSPVLLNGLNDLVKEGYPRIPARLEKYGVTMTDISNLHDFVKAYHEWAAQVAMQASDATAALQQVSILRITALSRHWHQWQIQALEESLAEGSADDLEHWPTFIHTPGLCNDLVVMPLNTPWHLKHEGSKMQHCVGGYTSSCLFYGAHIFSIRNRASGQPLSTFEIRLSDDIAEPDPFYVMQHRGPHNSNPPENCNAALGAFLQHLKLTVTAEQLRDIRWQQYKRCENSEEYHRMIASPAWSRRMIDGFRELLRECPVLLGIND